MYLSELNENVSIYSLTAFLGKSNNKDKKLYLITPKHKLKFSLKKDAYKKKNRTQTRKSSHKNLV